jgi:hypothetical protein
MCAACRRLLSMCAAVLWLLATYQPVMAVDKPPGAPAPSPNDCVVVYQGSLGQQGAPVDYQAGAGIACGRPGNTAPYGAGSAYTASSGVADGTACTVLFYAPVRFQNLPSSVRASWTSPAGYAGAASLDPNSNGEVLSAAGATAATNDVFAVYSSPGTFQGQQCQGTGVWQDFCQLGEPSANPDPCILTQVHRITPASSPPPPVGPYVASVVRDLRAAAGTVRSLPSPNGLVNLPTCFWIDGMGVPAERDLKLVLPGPPDGSGRRIYYTYLIRVFFAGIDWSFDDPFGNGEVLPNPACGQQPHLTAHTYQMISEKRSADGFYHVSATERYQVTVDLYWADTYGPHHASVDPGVPLPITVSPPQPYDQYVGQVEAVPMAG